MEARIVIILPEHNKGRWQVNLTDGRDVWGKRYFTDADAALAYVLALIEDGARPAFLNALCDLLTATTLTAAPLSAA